MQSIGAYFQCYKNPRATYETLKSFRNYYPNNTVVLVSDNGYDYTNMAKYFNCIYIHDKENISLIYKDTCSDTFRIEKVNKLINRIHNAINLCIEDYIIILEDDVKFNNNINDTFKYELNGYCPNSFQKRCINELSKTYTNLDTNKIYNFTGHGGSVYHKNSLIECLENKTIIDNILLNWKNYYFDELVYDLFFSLLIILNNYNIGPYNGHHDSSGAIIQHQYKVWYNQDMPQELKYLVSID